MNTKEKDNFRDHISTTNEEGMRSWVYAAQPKGTLHNYRFTVSLILLAIFFITPFIRVHNEPFLLFNILDRHFIIFGKVFWPQDFHLFVIAVITLVITIVLFTVIYGRIWCGWACPQTIFLEMVYRKIEFLIEGSAAKQRKLDTGPFSFEKVWKKGLKHILFILIAITVINTLLSYIIGTDKLFSLIEAGPTGNIGLFAAIALLTAAYYFVFARFREQVCTLVCPYGRLQGVMLDANSLVVHYDFKRGEGRGKWKKNEDRSSENKGDCIDCGNCISVCPTGIDVRNGTQLECINCTACIDSCNSVMNKIGFKPGLIRIASYNEINENRTFRFTPRIIAYTTLLIVLISTLVILFATRNETETTILHVPGSLYQDMGEEMSNIYNLKLINKSSRDMNLELRLLDKEGKIQIIGHALHVDSQEATEAVFLLLLPKEQITSSKTSVTFGIFYDGEMIEKENSTFVGP